MAREYPLELYRNFGIMDILVPFFLAKQPVQKEFFTIQESLTI